MNKKDAKTAILTAAETLFLKHGFRRVSVDEICRNAGVSRKTFYVYFANKDVLTIELLDTIIDTLTNDFVEVMQSDVPFSNKMASMMEMKLAVSRKLSMDFMSDLYAISGDVLLHYQKKADRNIALAHSLFVQAHEKGEIRSELNVDIVMAIFNYQMELCGKPEFRAHFKDVESMSKQMMEMILYGIFGGR
jgi:AcrR family transcriptional regulator